LLGIIYSIAAAGTFALNAAAARRAVLSGTVLQGLMVTVPLGVPLFLILMFVTGESGLLSRFPLEAYIWFAAAGIVHFVIGRYGNYSASAAIGTNLASPILQSEVIITLVLAMFVLGESLTPLRALGIALVLIGPGLVGRGQSPTRAGAGVASAASPAFQPRYAEGYAYAVVAAIGYGLSPVFITLGLRAAGGTGALAGGFVSYLAATLTVGVALVVLQVPRSTYRLSGTALRWFLFAGVIVFASQAFRYAALVYAPASVVTALQRLSSLFRIYFGWIINREHEVFDRSVFTATAVSMIGAMALSVSTEMFLSLASWPDWLVGFAKLKWP
jgi:drug/metabolite transporter (DMT)-like permease